MVKYIARITSFVLAFGFFIGCSTLFNSSQKEKIKSEKLSAAELNQKIERISKQLQKNQKKPDLWYRKGLLLTKVAQKQEKAEKRVPYYTEARQALKHSIALYQPTGNTEQVENITQLLNITWSNEHNQGVQVMQDDSIANHYSKAAAHFKNATVIIPDSSISYEMEAKAFYKNNQSRQALKSLEQAKQNINDLPAYLLEDLGFLYLQDNKPQKAVDIYENARSLSHRNLNLMHGLSNAYMNANEHQKAIPLLNVLFQHDSSNIVYGKSLATEQYMAASQKMNQILQSLKNGTSLGKTEFSTADSLLEQAKGIFGKMVQENSDDSDLKKRASSFYQNSAALLQSLMPYLDSYKRHSLQDEISQYLSLSIPLLRTLSGNEPNNKRFIQNLYQAYAYLGMKEEAQTFKAKL